MRKEIILYALYCWGVKENSHEARRYFQQIGFEKYWNDGKTPWCAAFVGYVLKQSGYNYLKTLRARNYLILPKVKTPLIGDVVVFWRGDHDDGSKGHVGFYVGERDDEIYVLGGNQNDTVCVKSYPKSKLLGYRRPVR